MINKSLGKSILHQKVNTVLKLDMKSNVAFRLNARTISWLINRSHRKTKRKLAIGFPAG